MSRLFREKSLQRISSPEQLNAYIRVSTPSVWLLLSAIVVLLAGVCVWGVFGHMDTALTAAAVADGGGVTAYVRASDAEKISAGARASVGGAEGTVLSVSAQPVRADEGFTDYMLHVGSLQKGEWVHAVVLDAECEDGVYEARIVLDSVSPMSFVLN